MENLVLFFVCVSEGHENNNKEKSGTYLEGVCLVIEFQGIVFAVSVRQVGRVGLYLMIHHVHQLLRRRVLEVNVLQYHQFHIAVFE